MKSIDIKSLLIGILGTLLVIACTAATTTVKVPSGTNGKYQTSFTGHPRRMCVILDTSSGSIVGKVEMSDVKFNNALISQNVRD